MSVIVPATALAVSSATVAVRKPHPDSVRNCSPANLPLVSSDAWSHRGLISIYRRPAVLPCVLACLSSSSSSGSSSSLPKETISSASTKLFVSGLSFRTTEESLRNAFEKFGQLTEVNLVMDKIAKRPRGFAFLHYATEEESKKAIEGMHGKFLDGRVIFVEKAKPRSEVRNKGSPIRC